jgi:Kef-type K+ transport system membrane component KefB
MDFPQLLATLAATIVATKLLGEIAQRLGQPAVLGELLAGVLLGGSALHIFDAHDPVLHALAELGVLVLLFQIGLHTDLRSLRRVGGPAMMVAVAGVVLPFTGGVAAALALGMGQLPALVAGAALTATSIGISARILSDLGRLHTAEGQVVLGAAVADDVMGLILLSVVTALAGGAAVSVGSVATTTGVAVGFIVIALALGAAAIPPLFKVVDRVRITGALGLIALAFALLMAWAADRSGSAMIIGAFAAGLILHPTPQRHEIEVSTTALGHFFVPIFFASVGASVDLAALATPTALTLGGALVVVGVIGKIAAGYAPWWYDGNKFLVGMAMVPRGEVGLIFAQMGLASGAITAEQFGALMLMVVVTTFMTPPLLGRIVQNADPDDDAPGTGGIDDLVAGTAIRTSRPTKPLRRS